MVLAAGGNDYPLMDLFWTMLIFFAWVIWFWLLIGVFSDIFRRHDLSGWGKGGWSVFVLFLPFIGVLTYMISQGSKMDERRREDVARQAAYAGYVPAGGGSAEQIAQAKKLLDEGTISAAEFDALKTKALAA
jgi:hypothetical protein